MIKSWRGFPLIDLGRQRRHSRNPALSACCGAGKKVTFSRLGRFEGHDGRQYTPVEDTAKTNLPSLVPSRAKTDCQRASSVKETISNCASVCGLNLSIALFMFADYDAGEISTIRILRSNRFFCT